MADKTKIAVGETTDNAGHVHKYTIYSDNTVMIHEAVHPNEYRIRHNHVYVGHWPNGYISNNKSDCHPECSELYGIDGVDYHAHGLIVNEQIRGGSNMATRYIYQDTGQPYDGRIVKVGDTMYSTPDGALNGSSRVLQPVTVGRATPMTRNNNTRRSVSRSTRTTAGARLNNSRPVLPSLAERNSLNATTAVQRNTIPENRGSSLTTMSQRRNMTRNNMRNNRNNVQTRRATSMNRTSNRTQTRRTTSTSMRSTPMRTTRRSGGGGY